MRWKNWPYWMRGGVIGVLILIFLTIIAFIGYSLNLGSFDLELIVQVDLESIIHNTIGLGVSIPPKLNIIADLIVSIIGYFLLGAIIGIIIGKIKSRSAK